eukprot:6644632-Pyramimonas_sp.AAC.1
MTADRSRSRVIERAPPAKTATGRATLPGENAAVPQTPVRDATPPPAAKASAPSSQGSRQSTLDYGDAREPSLDYGQTLTPTLGPLPEIPLPGASPAGPSPTTSELERSRARNYGPAPDPRDQPR